MRDSGGGGGADGQGGTSSAATLPRRLSNGGGGSAASSQPPPPPLPSEHDESKLVEYEAYENQHWSSSKWDWVPSGPDEHLRHWTTRTGKPLPQLEEIIPPPDYGWVTNWKVDTSPLPPGDGTRDREGWEYSTSLDKLVGSSRLPRGDVRWSDRARRRRWVRKMKPKTMLKDPRAVKELIKQAQEGLKGLVKGRLKVQELVDTIGKTKDSAELRESLWDVVEMVNRHAEEVEYLLRSLDLKVVTAGKKLLNDFEKEKRALASLVAEADRKDKATPVRSVKREGVSSTTQSPSTPNITPEAVTAGKTQFRFLGAKGVEAGEGVYMPRDTQVIKVIDELEVNATIIEERVEAINEINRAVVELRDVFLDFAKLVHDQQAGIDEIEMNAEKAHANVGEGLAQIMNAERLQKEGYCRVQ